MKLRLIILFAICVTPLVFLRHDTTAQDKQPKKDVIPHAQDKMPGPALTPQEALKKMQVPPGFRVELVAAEPDIVNPVAMTFDERGRIWITESIEYPKKAAGPGKDRVKVLESTKGDGKFDKVTTVIDGLNIPSGIAIGHGGVWVCNSPDILFYPFEDFDIFCEGTSNPWGLAFNDNGDAFVSACVIDHLWHLTETGYYQRQGGPYPAYTWKLGSIVKHRHQKAAYCGLHFF